MKTFAIDDYRTPLHARTAPEPTVGDRDVLVEVKAASVNQLDVKIAEGAFKALLPAEFPMTLGHDFAGVVVATGKDLAGFAVGDRVFGRPRDGRVGTFAELIAVDEHDLAQAPVGLSLDEAASLPLVALTAWQALVEIAAVQPGQMVLIHAGAGGVGSIAIQLAKHLGAHVATTVSATNAALVRSLGADIVIDYRTQDFAQELSGYDLVLDGVGGENLERSLRVLRPGGRAIGIAGPATPDFARAIGANLLVRTALAGVSAKVRAQAKRLGVTYEFLWMRADGEQLAEIAALAEAGILRPQIGATFPFDETPTAFAALTEGGRAGKIVVHRD